MLLVGCRYAGSLWACYPEPSPDGGGDYAALSRQVDDIVSAPPGATGTIQASADEWAAYLSQDILPLAGATGYHCDVRFAPEAVSVTLRDSGNRPLLLVAARTDDSHGALALSRACLGPVQLPQALLSPANRVLAATLSSGELGISLVDARVVDGRLYLTLKRY
ncbi:MAG: hypothetical protein ACYC5O_10995 [Anaerolineae bacterium]